MGGITIEFAQEKLETLNNKSLENKLDIILKSINDWPVEAKTLEEYCGMVEAFLGKSVTKDNLNLELKKINLKNHAWEAESLFQLLAMFDSYPENFTLIEIITGLNDEIV